MDSTPSCSNKKNLAERFLSLVRLVERLRGPGGCPWDRAQTALDLRTYILEEAYEVVEAIGRNETTSLCEELGDLLLQVLFLSCLAEEEGRFNLEDVVTAVHQKMIRRHPHVFGDEHAETPDHVVEKWNRIKVREKSAASGGTPPSASGRLEDVPAALPALYRAFKLSARASEVGFDWPGPDDVLDKLDEELNELRMARQLDDPLGIRHEVGDLLFVLASLSRLLGIDPEQALMECNTRFMRRFRRMEQLLADQGLTPEEADLEAMDRKWNEAKAEERSGEAARDG